MKQEQIQVFKTTANKKEETEEDKKDNENKEDDDSSDKIEPKPTLQEYLSKLFCNGCGKHCSLLSPKCGRGMQKAEIAKVQYNEKY